MKHSTASRSFLPLLLLPLTLLGAACSDSDTPTPGTDPPSTCDYELHDGCVGVSEASCVGDCSSGLPCSKVIDVAADADLAGALGAAQPGECVLLSQGDFGATTVPAGVSLIGQGANGTRVAGVTVAGSGSILRGLEVGGAGVKLDGADDARVEEVRVKSSAAHGIDVGASQGVTVAHSEITGAAQFGVQVADGSLSIVDSAIAQGAGPGVVVTCDGGCDCTADAAISVQGSLITGNSHVGLFASGAKVEITGSIISATEVLGLEPNSGGGVVAAACSTLNATGSEVRDNAYFGVLVDSSAGSLGKTGEENGIIIYGNVMGVFLQGLGTLETDGFSMNNAVIENNVGIGLGIGGGAKGIIIYGTQIKKTKGKTLPSAGGGAQTVGDGLIWAGTAQVNLDTVTVSESERQGVLIDGPVATGSAIANLTLEGGDETKGLVQQSVQTGDEAPAIGAATPALTTDDAEVFALPAPPAAPSP